MLLNNTPHPIAQAVLMDPQGGEVFVAAIKASYEWQRDGRLLPAAEQQPVHLLDAFSGPPESSALIGACELTLPKPRVDVILEGEIALRAAVEQVDCALEVGRRIRKVVRVFGARYWTAGVLRDLVPSRPKPFARMPITWERSFGGTDPEDPAVTERRNLVGLGLRKRAASLVGQPVPNFEDPRDLIEHSGSRPAPIGLGPVAPHWQPRQSLAGTYDDAWKEQRFPLLPVDFDPRFVNAAPADQQLDGYHPGEEVHLEYMSPAGHDRFTLPELDLPVAVVEGRSLIELAPVVDTVVIAPAAHRLSIVARVAHPLASDAASVSALLVGPLTRGQRRALEVGKPYVRARR